MEAIRRLAGGVAHEFNNLLTGIMGFSDLLLMRVGDNSTLRKDIESIKKASKQAASLSNQLLTFSRRQKVQMKVLDINDTISSIHSMVQNLLGEDIKLTLLLDPTLKEVKSNSGLINQLIINLVTNARDAMPNGGKLTISTENIVLYENESKTIPYSQPGKFVCLTLTDTGVGMDQDSIHRMFEPFFGTKEVGKGTGLGLSVVYGIIKQHEGWINVESKPGKGSTFKIYFPVTSEKVEEKTRETIKKEQFYGAGKTILVVEDEEIVRELASRVFRENGYIVFEAANSQEAMAIFEREKGEFHLVFSDVVMPGENGIQLVNNLLLQKPELKVLFSSGYTDDKSQRALIAEKGFKFLQKPYTPDELLQKVEQIIEQE
jgi:CheY-like chemotaxis protein